MSSPEKKALDFLFTSPMQQDVTKVTPTSQQMPNEVHPLLKGIGTAIKHPIATAKAGYEAFQDIRPPEEASRDPKVYGDWLLNSVRGLMGVPSQEEYEKMTPEQQIGSQFEFMASTQPANVGKNIAGGAVRRVGKKLAEKTTEHPLTRSVVKGSYARNKTKYESSMERMLDDIDRRIKDIEGTKKTKEYKRDITWMEEDENKIKEFRKTLANIDEKMPVWMTEQKDEMKGIINNRISELERGIKIRKDVFDKTEKDLSNLKLSREETASELKSLQDIENFPVFYEKRMKQIDDDIALIRGDKEKATDPEEISFYNDMIRSLNEDRRNINLVKENIGQGNELTRVYHGSSSAFESFDPDKLDPHSLYGPGYYFTENPKIAEGYTRKGSDVINYSVADQKRMDEILLKRSDLYTDQLNISARLNDLEKQKMHYIDHPEYERYAALKKEFSTAEKNWNKLQDEFEEMQSKYKRPNIRPARLAVENPFDIDKTYSLSKLPKPLVKAIEDELGSRLFGAGWREFRDKQPELWKKRLGDHSKNSMKGEHIYNLISGFHGNKARTNELLKEAGFDGITHIGGARTGNDPHRVWILFDKNKIFSPFGDPKKSKVIGFNEGDEKENPVDKLFTSPKLGNA